MEQKYIDARGLACPLPVVKAKDTLSTMEEGSVTVDVDNEIAVQNLTKFAGQKGFAVASETKSPRHYTVTITKSAMGDNQPDVHLQSEETGKHSDTGESHEITCLPDGRQKGLLVVLSGNTMGTGEEQLGKNLMKAFVFALTKQDRLPEKILCYNTGAYLTTRGSEVIEDLKSLEAEGVEILTCGTCMDYYGLKENLAVGTVTNMYEIVELMESAVRVVKP